MLNMYKAFDMLEYGKMRYNLLGNGGHWFPGEKVSGIDFEKLENALKGYRFAERVPRMLREAHALFDGESKKRLSQS
jgi:predicted aldo/keto reductase-like oxidoreductase